MKKKVFVGLSGGVDSAVSVALLRDQGYDVTGVFIKVWHPDFLPCTWRDERRDAMRVAAKLDIPFLFFDFEEEYRKEVAEVMIEEYKKGRTPNPDILCNREVKFGAFWKKAQEMGADFIATGHYAQKIIDEQFSNTNNIQYKLCEAIDAEKDQTYFLWTLNPADLEHILFPIGHLKKLEVRSLARKYGLAQADKKDSQGICFIGKVGIEEFLSHFVNVEKGDLLNAKGEVVGSHNGAIFYTLGERHGFDVTKKSNDSEAFYVILKDVLKNTITVSNLPLEIQNSKRTAILITNSNLRNLNGETKFEARIRYRQQKFPVEIIENKIILLEPQTVASGQSLVVYRNNEVLGGGIVN